MQFFRVGIIFLSVVFLHSGCVTEYENAEEELLGYSYFPLETGNYRIYEVVDIRYTIQDQIDSSLYYLKERTGEPFIDQAGDTAYFIYTYKRNNFLEDWYEGPVKVQTVKRSRTNLLVTADNMPTVKLVFPVKAGSTWDGNAFNTKEPQMFRYEDNLPPVDFPLAGSGKLIRVIQNDFDDEIFFRDLQYEVYAENTGMIYHETSLLEYCQETSCLGQKKIIAGEEMFQSLIEYGKE